MARLEGINQSVNCAWHRLQQTGAFDASRAWNTESWQRNVREAERELGEAARDLVAADNQDAYGELEDQVRNDLWRAILAGRFTDTGIRIISALGARYRSMRNHVSAAERQLSSRANGFPVRLLRHNGERIRSASPDRATVVEQQAIADGDPPPQEVRPEEARLYQRIVTRAMELADREDMRTRNPGDAALGAFGQSLLPPVTLSANAENYAEGQAMELAFGQRANAVGAIFGVLKAVTDGADAYRRASDDEYRLNYWTREVCLQEVGGDANQALALRQRLQNILERINAWMEWVQRHEDHPSYHPPYPTIRADPHASLDLARPGGGNNTGPVRGPVRGPANRGPHGMA